jgi:hypothetical protein
MLALFLFGLLLLLLVFLGWSSMTNSAWSLSSPVLELELERPLSSMKD